MSVLTLCRWWHIGCWCTHLIAYMYITMIMRTRTLDPINPGLIEFSIVQTYLYILQWLVWWCLMPLSTVLLVEETGENHWPVASHWQTLPHNLLYTSPWSRFELTTLVVIGTDCIGSKSQWCFMSNTIKYHCRFWESRKIEPSIPNVKLDNTCTWWR